MREFDLLGSSLESSFFDSQQRLESPSPVPSSSSRRLREMESLELSKSLLGMRPPWPPPWRQVVLHRQRLGQQLANDDDDEDGDNLRSAASSRDRFCGVTAHIYFGCVYWVGVRAAMGHAIFGMATNLQVSTLFTICIALPGLLGNVATVLSTYPFLSSKYDFEKRSKKRDGGGAFAMAEIAFAGRIAGGFFLFWAIVGVVVSALWAESVCRDQAQGSKSASCNFKYWFTFNLMQICSTVN